MRFLTDDKIRVTLFLPNGEKKTARLPTDQPVKKITSTLVSKLNLPPNDSQGRPISYALFSKDVGSRLDPDQTLRGQSSPVPDGTELRIEETMVPG